jgi:hypothetical protein
MTKPPAGRRSTGSNLDDLLHFDGPGARPAQLYRPGRASCLPERPVITMLPVGRRAETQVPLQGCTHVLPSYDV